MIESKKIGAVFSYIATVMNSLTSIFLTPFILSCLGDVEYGVYRTVQSLTGQLALISIGIGTVSSVFIAKFNARNDEKVKEERENFLATAIGVAFIVAVLAFTAGLVMFLFVDKIYANTMNAEQIKLVENMFLILVGNVALYLFRDVFVGIVHGYEKFTYSNFLKVARIVLRVIIILILLNMGMKALALVWCDFAITVLLLISDWIYCKCVLNLKIRFHYFDRGFFKTLFTFSLAMFLQTIVNQVNQNLSGVILGVMVKPELVTVYSLALTIYVAFNGISGSIASMFTPEAARLVQNNAGIDAYMDFVIKVGRIQNLVGMLVIGGFVSVGREFVRLWVGTGKDDVYGLSLLLMIPMSVALTLCGANSILDGLLKRMGRSIILFVTAILNVVFSIVLIKYIGYWGAAVGNAVSVVLGQIILMCIYYRRIFGFKPFSYFAGIMKGVLPAAVISVAVSYPFTYLDVSDFAKLVIKGVVVVAVYGVCMLLFGLNDREKKMIFGKLQIKFK